jgi:hypothetical protein
LRIPARRRKSPAVSALGENARKPRPVAEILSGLTGQGRAAGVVRDRLDQLLREGGQMGLAHHDVIRAVMSWAAEQGYAAGGYPQTRSLMLDALETVLLLDASKKKNAA